MTLKPCGTLAAHMRHIRAGETPCQPCRQVYLARQQTYRERRRERRHATPAPQPPVDSRRPMPTPEPGVFDRAACRPWTGSHDSRRRGESDKQWRDRLGQARAVCGTCPARAACREQADTYRATGRGLDGIFAGRHYQHGGDDE